MEELCSFRPNNKQMTMDGQHVSDIGVPSLLPHASKQSPDSHFRWHDLQKMRGSFCVDHHSDQYAGWQHNSSMNKQGSCVKIYCRRKESEGGLPECLMTGELPLPWHVFFAINVDVEYRPHWDAATIQASEIGLPCEPSQPGKKKHCRRLHWLVQLPSLLGRRDYVYEQRVHTEFDESGVPLRCLASEGIPSEESLRMQALEPGVTRISNWCSRTVIWPGTTVSSTCFSLLYFEDPESMAPAWMISRTLCSAFPSQLLRLIDASKEYPLHRLNQMLYNFGFDNGSHCRDDDDFHSCHSSDELHSLLCDADDWEECLLAEKPRAAISTQTIAKEGEGWLPWWFPQSGLLRRILPDHWVNRFSQLKHASDLFMCDVATSAVSFSTGVATAGRDFAGSRTGLSDLFTTVSDWDDEDRVATNAPLAFIPEKLLAKVRTLTAELQQVRTMWLSSHGIRQITTFRHRGAPQSASQFI